MYSSQRNVFKKATLSAAIAPILLTGASVHAQEGKTLQLEEVVVSAQRKTESLQDVPIAVAALSTDELTEKGILDTESLGQAVPGLVISTQDGRFFPRLRGVGNSLVSAGYESGIATYVDGVYYASATTGSMVLSNVERIEVIKGPQGTLFGRNATGGLIQVVTKKPEHEFGGDISMSVANYDTVTATGYVTGGINDKVAADFAFHYAEQGEGWGTNLANGRDVYRQDDELVLRTALLINPSDRTEIRLAADMNESNGSMSAIQPIKGFNFYPFLNAQEIKNDYDISADLHPESNYEGSGLSAHIEHELGSVIFTSITAVRESELYYTNDTETTRTPFVNLIFAQKDEQISQEFQLASNNDSDLSWVAGVYYFDGESKFDPFHVYLYGLASAGAGGLEEQILYPVLNNEAYAVYGQGTYSLTADTSLTLGIRSSEEERAIESSETLVVTGVGTLPSTPLPEKSEDYSKVTYRVAIDHAFNEQMMGYISYNTGFKSGGYNASNYSSQIDTEPYDPENIEAWEVGLKSDLFDNRLRLNTAVFFYNYEDIQLSRFERGSTFFYNGAEAELYGIDVDFEVLLTERLTLTGGVSYLNTEFTDLPSVVHHQPNPDPAQGGNIETFEDASGNNLPRAPELTGSLALQYFVPMENGDLTLSTLYSYNDGYYAGPDNIVDQPSYSMLNLSAMYALHNGYQISVWVRNVTDEYATHSQYSSKDTYVGAYLPPRTFGVTAKYSF